MHHVKPPPMTIDKMVATYGEWSTRAGFAAWHRRIMGTPEGAAGFIERQFKYETGINATDRNADIVACVQARAIARPK